MDIDCDGVQGSPADDGRCGNSGDTQSITSFADTVRDYGVGIDDLDANAHPYVVFGNAGEKAGYTTFDPKEYGIEPLSVIAVVCGDKLVRFLSLYFFPFSWRMKIKTEIKTEIKTDIKTRIEIEKKPKEVSSP